MVLRATRQVVAVHSDSDTADRSFEPGSLHIIVEGFFTYHRKRKAPVDQGIIE